MTATGVGPRLALAMLAVHTDIFPLDRQRPGVTHIVEGDDDVFELDIAVAERAVVVEADPDCHRDSLRPVGGAHEQRIAEIACRPRRVCRR